MLCLFSDHNGMKLKINNKLQELFKYMQNEHNTPERTVGHNKKKEVPRPSVWNIFDICPISAVECLHLFMLLPSSKTVFSFPRL